MRMLKHQLLLLSFIILALMLSACKSSGNSSTDNSSTDKNATADTDATAPGEDSISLTDMHGRKVTLSGPAERIVVLTAGECEILYAIGAGDRIIARGEYCDYPALALELPSVESGAQTNIEEIIANKPDVVIMSSMAQSKNQIDQLEALDINVVVLACQSIDDIYEAISIMGKITAKDAEAEELISGMKGEFDTLSTKAEAAAGDDVRASVFFEVSPLEAGLWAAGKNSFMDEIAGMLCLRNIFEDVDAWGQVSQEQVIERNPDYIITSAMYFDDGPSPVDEIMTRSGWENVSAIADNHVFHTDSDEITRPGPRLVDAAKMLYEEIYA